MTKENLRKNCSRICTVMLWVGVLVTTTISCIHRKESFSQRRQLKTTTQILIDPKTVEVKPKKSQQYIWTQVTSGENNNNNNDDYGKYLEQDYDNNSNNAASLFEHCRPGQCRNDFRRIDQSAALWKLTEEVQIDGKRSQVHLANLTDVLDYFPNHIIHNNERSCNIFFAGDSLSSDHAMAASCQLLHSGYTVKSMNINHTFYQGKDGGYGKDLDKQSEVDMYPGADHILLEKPNSSSCRQVLILYSWGSMVERVLNNKALRTVKEDGGVVVYNAGVHCNKPNTNCISDMMKKELLPMVEGENAMKYSRWRFLFRESEPQHFNTDDGLYDRDEVKRRKHAGESMCGPLVVENNWRNEEAADFLLRNNPNLASRVKTIPIHGPLASLWQLHFDGDCTHYCYDPYRFDVTWDGMLKALTSYDDDQEQQKLKTS